MVAAGLIAASVTALPAQKWDIPPRGVVFYKRTTEMDPARNTPGFARHVVPSVLLQSELDSRQMFVKKPPAHLQDLAMWLAFDVRRWRKKGKFRAEIPFILPFGTLKIVGTTSAIDEGGLQRIDAKITRAAPELGTEPREVFAAFHQKQSNTDIVAEIQIERRFLAAKGVITWMESNFFGTTRPLPLADGKPGPETEFAFHEEWRFDKVAPNRYPGFVPKVAEAIRKGADNIRRAIANTEKSTLAGKESGARTVGSGRLALALLTLLKADIHPKDEVVQQGFAVLRDRVIRGTYECACALMAMEALYAPPNERQLFIEGRIEKPIPRKPTAKDKKIMEEWVAEILANTDARIKDWEKAYLLRFNYIARATRYDNSVTQYAVLGLYSAHLCGLSISPTVWFAIAKHELWDQKKVKDVRIPLALTSQKKYQKIREATTRTVVARRMTEPWGWPYNVPHRRNKNRTRQLTGSMTVAGISDLTICDAVLRAGRRGGPLLKELRTGIRRGFAWVLHNFSVRDNPHRNSSYFYYLYGLERAAELGHVALIGDRDWYFEGATMLLGMQRKNGSFAGLVDSCFAVLFLKQAAPPLPVLTGR